MPTEIVTKNGHRTIPVPIVSAEDHELRVAARHQIKRVHRLRIHAVAWALGAILLTLLWVLEEWQANGSFEHFGNSGNAGDWNPTVWALPIGIWGLVVGIAALRVYFERPPTEAEVDAELARLEPSESSQPELRRFARSRLEDVRRLKFHAASWALGMVVLTPLWALIEWQDNGGFERWSDNGNRGDWEPTMLYVAVIWAFVIGVLALRHSLDRPTTEAEIQRELERIRSRST